jgi:dihydrofolate synthase/folylpolyglutamate synthase
LPSFSGPSYPDSVAYLYSLGNEIKSLKFGLQGIRTLLHALGQPQNSFRSVHVAGTNGKGSTSAMIEAGLRAAGFRTGLFTSPHLQEPTERIQIDGVPVSAEEFTDAFERVHRTVEELVRDGKLENHTTYFETVTAMAFVVFRERGVEIAVVEVGMGGRLDATNTLEPVLCVITPIDFDHEAFLGNSIEAIAGEKAGILKLGVPAVFGAQRAEAAAVLERASVDFVRTSEYSIEDLRIDARGSDFVARRSTLVAVHCPLAGRHQVENALTAVAALERLGVSAPVISQGIGAVIWPGRLEFVGSKPDFLLDGAHNPAGARALASYLREFHARRKTWLIYGAMRDKSVEEITEILFPLADTLILSAPEGARGLRAQALATSSGREDALVAANLDDALGLAHTAEAEDLIVLTGSLYLVGEARRRLVK